MKIFTFFISLICILVSCVYSLQVAVKQDQKLSQSQDNIKAQRKTESKTSNGVTKTQNESELKQNIIQANVNNNASISAESNQVQKGSSKTSVANESSRNIQRSALARTNMEFINTIAKGIPDSNASDTNSFNLNILIGNTDSTITNQNLRNNNSFNKK